MDFGRKAICGAAALLLIATGGIGCGGDSDDDEGGSADNAIEFVGRIDQVATNFTGYGYVTHLEGVDGADLTSEGGSEISEKDARITYLFKVKLASRAVVGKVFALDVEGTVSFYLDDDPGASFSDPESFAQGEEIAKAHLRVQNSVTVYAPNQGIADASGELDFDRAESFDLGGNEVSLDDQGERQRLTLAGRGVRTDALLPSSNFDFAAQTSAIDD